MKKRKEKRRNSSVRIYIYIYVYIYIYTTNDGRQERLGTSTSARPNVCYLPPLDTGRPDLMCDYLLRARNLAAHLRAWIIRARM